MLIIVIMLQSGSAADLAGAFGGAGSQTAFGPRGAATFLSRATTWCAIVFMMTSLTLSVKRTPTDQLGTGSILEETQKSGTSAREARYHAPIQFPAATESCSGAATASSGAAAAGPGAVAQEVVTNEALA